MARTRHGRFVNCALIFACAGAPIPAPLWVRAASAQSAPPTSPSPIDFGDVRLTNTPIFGPVAFSGARVHVWNQGQAQRITMTGPVRVRLGESEFVAARASAWLQPLQPGADGPVQVFVYLEKVSDPVAPVGGQTLTAEALPIRGVFVPAGGVQINADWRVDAAPAAKSAEASLIAASESAFTRMLLQVTGKDDGLPRLPPLPTYSPRTGDAAPKRDPRKLILVPPRPAPAQPHVRPDASSTSTTGPGQRPVPTGPSREITGVSPSTTPRSRTDAPESRPKPPDTRIAEGTPRDTAPGPAPQGETTPQATGPGATPGPQPGSGPVGATAPAPAVPTSPPAGTRRADDRDPTTQPIFTREGIVTLAPGDVTFAPGETESAVIASGGVTVQYADLAKDRVLQLTAQRAVVFLDPGKVEDLFRFRAENVRGIYLEGDVTASDGTYTTRGPQIYYDLRANKGVMLDAVFWTYDEQRQLPIYVRAKTIRQTAADTFTGENAKFTNSAFFEPGLSLGASKVTISRKSVKPVGQDTPGDTPASEERVTWIEADHITGRIGGVPVFWWPHYAGDPENRILKDIRVENRSGSGAGVLTTLDMYALAGLKRPRDITADLLADYFFDRGVATGARARWSRENHRGELFAYMVPFDKGTDVLSPGTRVDRDNEFRGILTAEQRWKLDDEWTLLGELSLISDEAFVDAFFKNAGEARREFTNRIAARRLRENSYFNAEISGTFQDFISNEYLLQSQGYSVTRTPELTYVRHADDLFAPGKAGLVTWFSEYRAGRLEMAFDEALASEHGFTTNALAQRALGVNANQSVADALRAAGFSEEAVFRADTRQELAATIMAGPIVINPFIVGRLSFWDSDFEAYSPDEDDQIRYWGGGGVRASTTLQRVYDGVDSRLLDLHRLRHVVEPNVTIWAAETNIDRGDIPLYDQDVEGILDGAMVRIGINQFFQTQRGAPGRWHNVDLVSLSTDFVFSSEETGTRYPYGKFFDFRPENSTPGDYFVADATMRLTDSTSLTGSTVFDLDESQQAATSVGVLLRQFPTFTAAADVRYLNPQDSTYLTGALAYELTSKYSVAFGASYDTDESQFQTLSALVQRKFSSMMLGVGVSNNEISDETSFFFVLRPYGARGQAGFSAAGDTIGSRFGGF